MVKDKTENTKIEKKSSKKDYIRAIGRRKEAVARLRLYQRVSSPILWGQQQIQKGEIYVNQLPIERYFSGQTQKVVYSEPFRITNTLDKFAITVKVEGGGKAGQLGALVHALARALEKVDREKFRPILKKKGFLTRDARAKERRKVGTGGKARRKKQSPKR